MEIKFGLISADSHVALDRDAFTKRMSAAKWGERIPEVVGVDAEVLFTNNPAPNFVGPKDADFELDACRAYNDAVAEWRQASDRYVPLALVPYLSDISVLVNEIERSYELGHRGVNLLGQMPKGIQSLTDPHWYPMWDVCQ